MTDEKDIKTPVPAKVSEDKPVATTEVPKKEEETKEVEVPAKFLKLVEEIEKMSVLELSELVKILEEKFGVSAAMAVAAAPAGGDAGEAPEKTSVDVMLVSAGQSKIQVIKVVKDLTGKGLKDAKDVVDAAPVAIASGVTPEEAEETKAKLEEAGATVEIK